MLTCLLISFHRSVGPSSRPQVCFSACITLLQISYRILQWVSLRIMDNYLLYDFVLVFSKPVCSQVSTSTCKSFFSIVISWGSKQALTDSTRTGWYKRDEINRRCAFFFGGAVMAGAFGGILGCKSGCSGGNTELTEHWHAVDGLSKMDGVGGKQGWSWIVGFSDYQSEKMANNYG